MVPAVVTIAAITSAPVQILTIKVRIGTGKAPVSQEVQIFRVDDAVLYRLPLMDIDLDGAPNTYHPPTPGHPHGNGPGLGLGDLRNASKNLDDGPNVVWVGIVTDSRGKPLVQNEGPFAGFYISQTTLQDPHFAKADPRRYVDATTVPYVVLNPILRKKAGLDIGDLAAVVLGSNEHKVTFGIVADVGPLTGLGECSRALATSLGISSGIEGSQLTYIFFPTPNERKVRTIQQIRHEAEALFAAWGGVSRLSELP